VFSYQGVSAARKIEKNFSARRERGEGIKNHAWIWAKIWRNSFIESNLRTMA
jgi:hypothetical protein